MKADMRDDLQRRIAFINDYRAAHAEQRDVSKYVSALSRALHRIR